MSTQNVTGHRPPYLNTATLGAATVAGGAIGSAAGAIKEYGTQKYSLKNSEKVIADFNTKIKSAEMFTDSFFPSAEANKLKAKELKGKLTEFQEFVKNGKVDYKTVGKQALKFGAIGAAVGAGLIGLYNLGIKCSIFNGKQTVKVVSNVYDNPEVKGFHKEFVKDTASAIKEGLKEDNSQE